MVQMPPILEMGADQIRQVVDWACEAGPPHLALFAGSSVLDGLHCFAERGISAYGLVLGKTAQDGKWFTPEGNSVEQPANRAWDLVILHQDVFTQFRGGWFGDQGNHLGAVKRMILILDAASAAPVLPAASSWMASLGFTREIPNECWLNERYLLCAYRPIPADFSRMIEAYEARIWELGQLAQKRRALLGEYLNELIQSSFQMEQLEKVKLAKGEEKLRAVEDDSKRWHAFQLSRTGRLLQFFQAVRNKIFRTRA